ncbi:MAG: hypothetical protein OEQ49_15105 [Myxococcales bacterium]|nr:hypothetical protein [Myxococcales bacterium]
MALLALAAGCGDSGGDTIEVSLADLPCQMQSAQGIWESAPLPPITDEQCLWFLFRANNTYVFEHPLERVPFEVTGYIAFNSNGTASTIASGNAFLVDAADDSTITLRNGQNQDFWLRLVLE